MLGRDFPSTSCGKESLYRKTDFFQFHWLYWLDCFSTRDILFDIRKKLAIASFLLFFFSLELFSKIDDVVFDVIFDLWMGQCVIN